MQRFKTKKQVNKQRRWINLCVFIPMLQSYKTKHTVGAYYTFIGGTDTEHRNVFQTELKTHIQPKWAMPFQKIQIAKKNYNLPEPETQSCLDILDSPPYAEPLIRFSLNLKKKKTKPLTTKQSSQKKPFELRSAPFHERGQIAYLPHFLSRFWLILNLTLGCRHPVHGRACQGPNRGVWGLLSHIV